MKKNDKGLIMVFAGADIWLWAFTYAVLNSSFLNINVSSEFFSSFFGIWTISALLCAVICAVVGIFLIKTGSENT